MTVGAGGKHFIRIYREVTFIEIAVLAFVSLGSPDLSLSANIPAFRIYCEAMDVVGHTITFESIDRPKRSFVAAVDSAVE